MEKIFGNRRQNPADGVNHRRGAFGGAADCIHIFSRLQGIEITLPDELLLKLGLLDDVADTLGLGVLDYAHGQYLALFIHGQVVADGAVISLHRR